MRTFPKLWNRLQVEKTKRLNIIRDWTEGKVPDLPFEIIDQKNIKDHIQGKLENIFDRNMTTSILKAQYGDGKTNVFKCDASSKESVINALKERFPKWPDSIIMNHVNNKSNYVMESKTIKTIISEVLNEFIKREVI